jgi:hypothetical protein
VQNSTQHSAVRCWLTAPNVPRKVIRAAGQPI